MSNVQSSSPGLYGLLRLVAATVTPAAPTVDLEALAVGDVVIAAWAEVTTAFNAGTTNVVTLGDATTADLYLAAGDVAEGTPGVSPAGGKGPFPARTTAGTLRAAYTQTGTAATTGSATVCALITTAPA